MMIRFENREDWLRKRDELASSGRLGGSMVGTAAGVDPWKSPYQLWAEMRGEFTRPDLSDKESIRVGHDLEEYVARRFCEVSGKEKDRTTLLDLVGVGQMVEVEFYPDGREWVSPAGVKKWFASNTLAGLVPMGNAVKSSGSGVPRTPASASAAPVVPPSVEIEDLPF